MKAECLLSCQERRAATQAPAQDSPLPGISVCFLEGSRAWQRPQDTRVLVPPFLTSSHKNKLLSPLIHAAVNPAYCSEFPRTICIVFKFSKDILAYFQDLSPCFTTSPIYPCLGACEELQGAGGLTQQVGSSGSSHIPGSSGTSQHTPAVASRHWATQECSVPSAPGTQTLTGSLHLAQERPESWRRKKPPFTGHQNLHPLLFKSNSASVNKPITTGDSELVLAHLGTSSLAPSSWFCSHWGGLPP